MVTPSSLPGSILLLIASCCLLGLWPALFYRPNPRWRFQLFSIDFALGAAACGVLAAFTLGSAGEGATFSDRMLIAGGLASVYAAAAGILAGLANMLLLGSMSLIGMSTSFVLGGSVALIVVAARSFGAGNAMLSAAALLLLAAAAWLAVRAGQVRAQVGRPFSTEPITRERHIRTLRYWRGAAISLIAGLLLGGAQSFLSRVADPDYGPGPYACNLMMMIGAFLSALLFVPFLLKISIDGTPLLVVEYGRGPLRQHVWGLIAGLAWAAGVLAAFLAVESTGPALPSLFLRLILPAGAVVLCFVWGWQRRREFQKAPARSRRLILLSVTGYVLGALAIGLSWHSART